MPEDNKTTKETDRGKEMKDLANKMAPQPVPAEQFGAEGTYMEPNAAQIPWPNVPYDPADSRPNPDSEMEGQAEELTGKKPTKDRWGNEIEEVEAPRGEPQDVAAGIAWNAPTSEELAEDRAGNLNQSRQGLEQRRQQSSQGQNQDRDRQRQQEEQRRRQTQNQGQGQGKGEHPHGGPPGQTGEHPQGGPPGQQPRPNQDLPGGEQPQAEPNSDENGEKRRKELEERHRKEREEHEKAERERQQGQDPRQRR